MGHPPSQTVEPQQASHGQGSILPYLEMLLGTEAEQELHP